MEARPPPWPISPCWVWPDFQWLYAHTAARCPWLSGGIRLGIKCLITRGNQAMVLSQTRRLNGSRGESHPCWAKGPPEYVDRRVGVTVRHHSADPTPMNPVLKLRRNLPASGAGPRRIPGVHLDQLPPGPCCLVPELLTNQSPGLVPSPDTFVDTGKLPLTLDSCLLGND